MIFFSFALARFVLPRSRSPCPLLSEFGERGLLFGGQPVASLALVRHLYTRTVFAPVREPLDVPPSRRSAAFPPHVLGEGLEAPVEGLRAPPGPERPRRSSRAPGCEWAGRWH